jgi:archaeosine-15-forming tRNA-guanine transglycosylase
MNTSVNHLVTEEVWVAGTHLFTERGDGFISLQIGDSSFLIRGADQTEIAVKMARDILSAVSKATGVSEKFIASKVATK